MAEMKKYQWGWGGKNYLPNLWIHYRMQDKDFNRFWDLQNGLCACCEVEFAHPFRRLGPLDKREGYRCEVDHNHETGKVRGLLCRLCNDFLGKVHNNRTLLTKLEAYLKRNGEMW